MPVSPDATSKSKPTGPNSGEAAGPMGPGARSSERCVPPRTGSVPEAAGGPRVRMVPPPGPWSVDQQRDRRGCAETLSGWGAGSCETSGDASGAAARRVTGTAVPWMAWRWASTLKRSEFCELGNCGEAGTSSLTVRPKGLRSMTRRGRAGATWIAPIPVGATRRGEPTGRPEFAARRGQGRCNRRARAGGRTRRYGPASQRGRRHRESDSAPAPTGKAPRRHRPQQGHPVGGLAACVPSPQTVSSG
jgi:hypothetical protein